MTTVCQLSAVGQQSSACQLFAVGQQSSVCQLLAVSQQSSVRQLLAVGQQSSLALGQWGPRHALLNESSSLGDQVENLQAITNLFWQMGPDRNCAGGQGRGEGDLAVGRLCKSQRRGSYMVRRFRSETGRWSLARAGLVTAIRAPLRRAAPFFPAGFGRQRGRGGGRIEFRLGGRSCRLWLWGCFAERLPGAKKLLCGPARLFFD